VTLLLAALALLPSTGCGFCAFNLGCGPGYCCDEFRCRECLMAARDVETDAAAVAGESEECPLNQIADFFANLLPPQQ